MMSLSVPAARVAIRSSLDGAIETHELEAHEELGGWAGEFDHRDDHHDSAPRPRPIVRVGGTPIDEPVDDEAAASAFGQERPRWNDRVATASLTDHDAAIPLPGRQRSAMPGTTSRGRVAPSRVARIITVCSGKGGVGKTNLAVNLSVALAQNGLDVVLVDADLGTANADVLCGLMPTGRLDHVVTPLPVHDAGRRTLLDIAVVAPGGFRLIPGSAGVARMADLEIAQQRQLLSDLCDLERSAEVLIIDTSAGVGRDVLDFVRIADEALVVTTPEPTAIADAYAVIKCLIRSEEHGRAVAAGLAKSDATSMSLNGVSSASSHSDTHLGPKLRVIVNEVVDAGEARRVFERLNVVALRFLGAKLELAGWIAQDLRVGDAVRARLPFVLHAPKAEATHDVRQIAEEITRTVIGVTKGGLSGSRGAGTLEGAARPSLLGRWLGRRGRA